MSAIEPSASTFSCGDVVIHPTRPWPWLGTVHPKLRNNCRMCSNCGEMRLHIFDETSASAKSELICDNCEEPMKVVDGENSSFLVASSVDQQNMEIQLLENSFPCKSMDKNKPNANAETPFSSAISFLAGSCGFSTGEKEKSSNKLWHATWFPLGEVSELDGTEIIILPYKQRSMFQEGSPVSKMDNSVVGLVKQVHRNIDVFLLPDYKNVVCGLPSDRLLPISHTEQAPGCYVIYKGWVGTVFNVYNRIYFQLSDGSEFFVSDDEMERISVHVTELDRKCNFESNQFYPCQSVKLRLCLLEKAVWLNGRTMEMGANFKERVEKSRRSFVTMRSMPRHVSIDELDVAIEKCSAACINGTVQESTVLYQEAVQKFSNFLKKNSATAVPSASTDVSEKLTSDLESIQTNNESAAVAEDDEEWVPATVLKVEPIKVEVEWISQVVADPSLSEPSMKANYIEQDEIKNLTTFRACRAYESFDLGVRYSCHLTPDDRQISAERWRREMLPEQQRQQIPLLDDSNVEVSRATVTPTDQQQPVYVSVARSTTKIDVLWENGVFETDLDPSQLSAQYAHPVDRDYFPAMYVLLQGASGSGVSTTVCTETSNNAVDEEPGAATAFPKSQSNSLPNIVVNNATNFRYKNVLANRFGVVRKARNAEKYATVDWYDFDPIEYQNCQRIGDDETLMQPIFVKTEDVSFYDLKFYHDFNYVGGSLVSRIKPKNESTPNVGYIRRKNPDGSVLVIWYDGVEETTQPWRLKQLNNRMFYSEYSASDADNDHYYSPTEHEYEDLEDFRYYDYASLSESQRNKRVALIVTLLQEVIPRLVRAISIAFKHFSTLDRKKFVKLTLSTNDVTNGFAQMPDFRECLKDIYDVELELMKSTKPTSRKNSFREDKLVWQCANWLYDWTEVMSTLHEDIRKDHYKTIAAVKNPIYTENLSKSEAKRSKIEALPIVVETASNDALVNVSFDSTVYNNDSSFVEQSLESESLMSIEVDEDPLAIEMMDLLRSIETGLSTVTGILAIPSSSDVTTCVILEYINNCRKENSANPPAMDNNNVQYADLATSHAFLLKLVSNSSKTSRLPCFSFAHRSDQDLSDLRPKWNVQSFKNGRFKRDDVEQTIKGESDVTAQVAVECVLSLVDSVLEGNRDLSCRDDNILSICNEIADGLCLSVLSILNSIVRRVGSHLSSEVAKLFETSNANNDFSKTDQGMSAGEESENNATCSATLSDDELNRDINVHHGCFEVLPNAPLSHRFVSKSLKGQNVPKSFFSAVRREIKLLQTSLPPGIFIKTYEDRMDLFSCMIVGPQGTPYADGLFFFDVRLREDYPSRPPHAFFKSMSKLLNPNLYEDGMVCLSLLGTWDGKEVELWSPTSTLLQVFVSIQSLILVSEPYFNEPGYEKEKGTATGATKSRDYNESAVLRTLESLKRILVSPPEPFRNDVLRHVKENGSRLIKLLEIYQRTDCDNSELSFPLFPVTQGFCLCIKRHSSTLLEAMQKFVTQCDEADVI